jgi:hypothetical protein
MSKHIITLDTPVAQVEQMVYDALTEINEHMTNVAECNHMGNLYDMVVSEFDVYDDAVTVEMVKRIREEWVADNCEVEAVEEETKTMSINNINNPAIIAEAVAAAIEEMKTMTDAEIHMWAGQWAELALKASWDQMSQAMATTFSDENQRRIASK